MECSDKSGNMVILARRGNMMTMSPVKAFALGTGVLPFINSSKVIEIGMAILPPSLCAPHLFTIINGLKEWPNGCFPTSNYFTILQDEAGDEESKAHEIHRGSLVHPTRVEQELSTPQAREGPVSAQDRGKRVKEDEFTSSSEPFPLRSWEDVSNMAIAYTSFDASVLKDYKTAHEVLNMLIFPIDANIVFEASRVERWRDAIRSFIRVSQFIRRFLYLHHYRCKLLIMAISLSVASPTHE